MKILVTGASGFIASQIVTDLLAAGHEVTCAVRNIDYTKNLFPNANMIACDFVLDNNPKIWVARLKNIDVVINCVGILYHPNKKIIWDIHYKTPKAIFDACVIAGVKKIIQISALDIDKTDVEYAKSKKAADDYLINLPITSVILRPSLVYGRGSYGGTSLFRGLSGLPFITPVPGDGKQTFQPIHLQDLSKSILNIIHNSEQKSTIYAAVGPQKIELNQILQKIRSWLGFAKNKLVNIPLKFIRIGSLFGNLSASSSLNDTSYKMLIQNNFATEKDTQAFHQDIGFIPRDFTTGLYSQPSTVQDHWHAKLFFVKPLLQYSIAFVWLITAFCTLFIAPKASMYYVLNMIGITGIWQYIVLYGTGILDGVLGILMLLGINIKKVAIWQITLILIYTIIVTLKLTYLWSDPFAAIAKNIPLMVATLILIALDSDR